MKGGQNYNSTFWRYFVNFWSLALLSLILFDFFKENTFSPLIGPVASIYTASLAIYSTQKEFERWNDFSDKKRHPGEIYVFIWTGIVLCIFLAGLFTKTQYKMPQEIFATYIVVLGILAVTKKSKIVYHEQGVYMDGVKHYHKKLSPKFKNKKNIKVRLE